MIRPTRVLVVGEAATGIVSAWFDRDGYGFITVPGVAQDLFVPRQSLVNTESLRRGAGVSFEVRLNARRRKFAGTVELLEPETRVCPTCKEEFVPVSPRQKHCRPSCTQLSKKGDAPLLDGGSLDDCDGSHA